MAVDAPERPRIRRGWSFVPEDADETLLDAGVPAPASLGFTVGDVVTIEGISERVFDPSWRFRVTEMHPAGGCWEVRFVPIRPNPAPPQTHHLFATDRPTPGAPRWVLANHDNYDSAGVG